MLYNYTKIAFRQFRKYKTSTAINLIGLSTGIAAFILIYLFVIDEISYDRHHEHAENIYRVTVKNFNTDGTVARQWAFASAGHAQKLKQDYATITHAVRFMPWAFPDLTFNGKTHYGEPVIFADEDVFEIFSFPFLLGNPESAFDDLKSLVLTEAAAIEIFGNDWREMDLLGKTVTLDMEGTAASYKVSGVMADMPENQHFHFHYLAPIENLDPFYDEDELKDVGGNYNWLTYIRVSEGANKYDLETTVSDFWNKYMGEIRGVPAENYYEFEFQPLLDIHLKSNLEGEYESNGSLQQVYIFSIIGILLILIASVNYMNLATSNFSRRMKEIGVRKVLGSQKSNLSVQFLIESMLIVMLSLPIAIMLAYLALPYVNNFMDKSLSLGIGDSIELFTLLAVLMIAIGLSAGTYPALFLSRMPMVQALKGKYAQKTNSVSFRTVLVTFQFVVVIGLIFALGVVESQMDFIRKKDPGFKKEAILNLSLSSNISNLETFKTKLLANPAIEKAAYTSRIPTGRLADNWGARFFNGDSVISIDFRLPVITVDEDFLPTYEIPLVAGQNFKKSMDTMKDSIGYFIINEAAAKALGFNNPNDIVNKNLQYGPFKGRIYGVTKDFHFESMHSPIVPMVMVKTDYRSRSISMSIKTDDYPATLAYVEDTWASFDQVNPADYRFLDERFEAQYESEKRLSQMIKVFTVLAILIGCLGLIGMVGFIIETKTKEIGVRKVLGASIGAIWLMISQKFLLLISISFVLVIPVGYLLLNEWLKNFVYRIDIGVFLVIMPLLIVSMITVITISYQALSAALKNPVWSLRSE